MNEINEIKIPKWVESISVERYDDRIVIELAPKEPRFKDGDFVYEDERIMIVKSYPNFYHANVWYIYSDKPAYNGTYAVNFSEPTFRHATEEEKQLLINEMRKDGKRWNADKKRIEDIPERKFKAGDKVALKSGCTSNTGLIYLSHFDEYIGKELTVYDYTESGNVICNNGFRFSEEWLEPCSEEPKNGDLAIFWDNGDVDNATISLYDKKGHIYHYDSRGIYWKNAIKFESKEQFEKVLRDKI